MTTITDEEIDSLENFTGFYKEGFTPFASERDLLIDLLPRLLQSYKEQKETLEGATFHGKPYHEVIELMTEAYKWCGSDSVKDFKSFMEVVFTTHKLQLSQKDQEIENLRKALEFYSKEEVYMKFSDDPRSGARIIYDQGLIARASLK